METDIIQDQLSANENAQGQNAYGTSNGQVQDIYSEIDQRKAAIGSRYKSNPRFL